MESFRSPIEITTVFFVLSIAFYVFLFWRSQAKAQAQPARERRSGDRRTIPSRTPVPTPIRQEKPVDLETLAINQLWEEDGTDSKITSH